MRLWIYGARHILVFVNPSPKPYHARIIVFARFEIHLIFRNGQPIVKRTNKEDVVLALPHRIQPKSNREILRIIGIDIIQQRRAVHVGGFNESGSYDIPRHQGDGNR